MVSENKHRVFSSISFVRISYKTIWLKTWSWYKTQWKNMRIKNMRGGSVRSDLKKPISSSWKRRKTNSSAISCATGGWGVIEHCFYAFKKAAYFTMTINFSEFLKFRLELFEKIWNPKLSVVRDLLYELTENKKNHPDLGVSHPT